MKVFYRTKKISNGQSIPYNVNIANALTGALALGLECIPYENVNNILNDYDIGDIVLDGIDQVQQCLDKFDIKPQEFNYPDVLKPYLGRKIWRDTINSIASDETKWSAGNFVKPIKEKVFTGKIISSIKDLIGCGSCYENYEVYVSEPLDFVYECRGFVYYDKLIDLRPYYGDYKYMKELDTELIECAMKDWITWKDRPNACSLDWGVVKGPHKIIINKMDKNKQLVKIDEYYEDGYDTVFIEGNLPYSLGSYGLNYINYIKLINAYISQIFGIEDELHFY
jgi:hypothetical protein